MQLLINLLPSAKGLEKVLLIETFMIWDNKK